MKPVVRLIGENGSVFNVIGLTAKALKKANLKDKAEEFTKKAFSAKSYDAVLALVQDYCEVT